MSLARSWSRRLLRSARSSPETLAAIARQGDGIPASALPSMNRISSNSFVRRGDGVMITRKNNLTMGDVDFNTRAGNNRLVFDSLDVPIDQNSLNVINTTNVRKYPDQMIWRKNVDNSNVQSSLVRRGENWDQTARISRQNDIDNYMATNPQATRANSTLTSKLGNVTHFLLATGAIVAGGLYLYSRFEDAIALNSGCFLVVRTVTGEVEWRRILGHGCQGSDRGDQLWLNQGLPTAIHPFRTELRAMDPVPSCSTDNIDGCYACNMDWLADKEFAVDEMSDDQTLICRQSNVWDVMGDVGQQIGVDIGGIVGGATGGLIDSIFGGGSTLWSLLIAGIVGIISQVVLGNFIQNKKLSIGLSLGIFVIIFLILRFNK